MSDSEYEQVPQDARKLSVFVGDWVVEGTMTDASTRSVVSGGWTFVEAIDGFGVHGMMKTDIEEIGSFEEMELIGFDAVDSTIHLISMNKFTIRDHIGHWSGDKLVTVYEGSGTNGRVTEEITVEVISPQRMLGHVVESVDDLVVLTTELTLDKLARS